MKQNQTITEDKLYNLFKKILNERYSNIVKTNHTKSVYYTEWVNQNGNTILSLYYRDLLVDSRYFWRIRRSMNLEYTYLIKLYIKYFKEKFPEIIFDNLYETDF